MIKTLVFDFGDVFINLDKTGAMQNALALFNVEQLPDELAAVNTLYEQGLLSTDEFLDFYSANFPKLSKEDIINAWNVILKDFPKHRLDFLKQLAESKKYKCILLSNTNELHIDWIKKHVSFYKEFKDYFDAFYLSHEINLRKPDASIFQFILSEHNLKPEDCLFIDDTKENTDAASILGFNVWNIDETTEDVTTLFKTQSHLF